MSLMDILKNKKKNTPKFKTTSKTLKILENLKNSPKISRKNVLCSPNKP